MATPSMRRVLLYQILLPPYARWHSRAIQAIGPIPFARHESNWTTRPAAQHLGGPGLPHTSQPQPEMAWSSMAFGIAIIGALAYNMGAAAGVRVPCSCSCPLSGSQSPACLAPGTWRLAAPRLGDTTTLRPHAPPELADWGSQTTASQPAGRTKIQSAACPAVDLGTFLLDDPARPLSPVARTGALGPPLFSCHSTEYHSTALLSHPSFVEQGWVWGKRILLGLLPQDMHALTAGSRYLPSSHAATCPEIRSKIQSRAQLPAKSQATISGCR